MPEIGQTLSHYRIVEKIGQGGMGEVYKAEDTKLGRNVALKFLPDAFTSDPERMARFEREAKLLASLNHPNIAGIYGLEQADGNRFLVLEYVEGETLQARISKGALPLEDALELCRQIAEGLEAAHEKGVIHRDLKPANVMITAEEKVKILDFGLAKAFSDDTQSIDSSQSPTLTEAMTRPGVILGTAAYMSPEQAKGKSVDKRADIWAFGCILYECLTGKRAFEGQTVTETLAAVIKEEPEFGLVPASVRLLVQKCLAKDRKIRLRDIGDGMALIGTEPEVNLGPVSSKVLSLPYAIAGIFFLIALVSVYMLLWSVSSDIAAPMHFKIKLPETMKGDSGLVLSPDGRYLSFTTISGENGDRLWIHDIQTDRNWPLRGTNAVLLGVPLWSPDGRFIVISDGQELRKIDVTSQQSVKLCDLPTHALGGFWTQDDTIVFGTNGGSIMKISASGGTPVPVTMRDGKEGGHFYPCLLSDGKHFLYVRSSTIAEDSGIYVGSLDVKPEDQEPVLVVKDGSGPIYYIPSNDSWLGQLIFRQDQILVARKFDEKRLRPVGDSVQIVDQLGRWWSAGFFSVSNNGLLVYGGKNLTATQYS
ncbi:MAG: protein kinase [Acidobacteriota bacterium]